MFHHINFTLYSNSASLLLQVYRSFHKLTKHNVGYSNKGINLDENYNNVLLPDLTNKNIYKIFPRGNKFYIEPNNDIKDLVIYGDNLPSSFNLKEYTRIVRYMVNIPNRILYILVGIILSDGYLEYSSKKGLENSIFQIPSDPDNAIDIDKGLYSSIKYNEKGLLTQHSCRLKFKQSLNNFQYV